MLKSTASIVHARVTIVDHPASVEDAMDVITPPSANGWPNNLQHRLSHPRDLTREPPHTNRFQLLPPSAQTAIYRQLAPWFTIPQTHESQSKFISGSEGLYITEQAKSLLEPTGEQLLSIATFGSSRVHIQRYVQL